MEGMETIKSENWIRVYVGVKANTAGVYSSIHGHIINAVISPFHNLCCHDAC